MSGRAEEWMKTIRKYARTMGIVVIDGDRKLSSRPGPSTIVLDAAERFVVILIEGAAESEGDSVIADTAGLGMAIGEWKGPEPHMDPDAFTSWCSDIEDHFRELFPRRKPRPLTADRCARVILDGFDAELLHIEDYRIDSIELLLALSRECGPTNRLELLRFVEAYVENATDEDFEAR
jgi:hypothetical protein